MKKLKPTKPLHPTDQEITDFIDSNLEVTRSKELIEHLVYCKDCSKLVIDVRRRIREEERSTVGTRPWYRDGRIQAVIFSGLVASFLIVFIYYSNVGDGNQFSLGKFSLSQQIRGNTLSITSHPTKDEIIDGDEVIKEIEKSLDLTSIKSFVRAEEAERKGDFRLALDLYYDDAFKEVETTLSEKEQLRWKILIYYRISRINFQESIDDKESYKDITKEWIQEYISDK